MDDLAIDDLFEFHGQSSIFLDYGNVVRFLGKHGG